MAEPLCDLSGGSIRNAPLAAILIEALRARVTGELRVDANGGTSRVYFRGGQPCGAQIFFGFKPLGQFLLELGWIDIEALERSLSALVDGRKQGEALVELGYLTRERLHLGLALHHQRHIRTLASVAEGSYSLQQVTELPRWTDELRLSAHRAILDALAEEPGQAVAARILSRVPAGLGLRLRSGWERFTGHFQLDPAESVFVSSLERPVAPERALASGDVTRERAKALLAALHLTGVLLPAPLGGEPLTGPWGTPGPLTTPGPRGSPGPARPPTPGPARPPQATQGQAVSIFTPGPPAAATPPFANRSAGPPPIPPPKPSFTERSAGPTPFAERSAGPAAFADRSAGPAQQGAGTALELDFGPGLGSAAATVVERPRSDSAGPAAHERAEMERQQRLAQEETRRLQAEREEAARAAREEALRRPAPSFASDPNEARERRTRLLQRAFGSIPGSEPLRTPAGGSVRGTPGPAARGTPGPAGTPGPSRAFPRLDDLPPPGDPAFDRYVRERIAALPGQDQFARLGVARTATRDQIKQAFFSAAKKFHPDRIPSAIAHLAPQLKELFGAINDAYQLLQDDERRQAYLASLDAPAPEPRGPTAADKAALATFEAQATEALKRRDFAAARKALTAALRIEEKPELKAHQLWANYGDKPQEMAARTRADLEAIVAGAPNCAAAHHYLGVLARLAGDMGRAEAAFRAVLAASPGHREAVQELRLIELRKANPLRRS